MAWCPVCFAMQFLDGGDLVQHYADGRAAPEDVDLDFDERCEGSDAPGLEERPTRTSDPDATWPCAACGRPGGASDWSITRIATGEQWHAECWHDQHNPWPPVQLDLLDLLTA